LIWLIAEPWTCSGPHRACRCIRWWRPSSVPVSPRRSAAGKFEKES